MIEGLVCVWSWRVLEMKMVLLKSGWLNEMIHHKLIQNEKNHLTMKMIHYE